MATAVRALLLDFATPTEGGDGEVLTYFENGPLVKKALAHSTAAGSFSEIITIISLYLASENVR